VAGELSGVYPAVVTPFGNDGSPDIEMLAAHCRELLAGGCHGLSILGTTGEANSLTVEERLAILDGLVERGIPPETLLPGLGCSAIADTVRLVEHALALGTTRVLLLPPFYYKYADDEGLFAAFAHVIEEVGDARLRIVLYHIPHVSGIAISEALIARLLEAYPEIVAGIKDSSRSVESLRAKCAFANFSVLAGTELLMLQTLDFGGTGCIAAMANLNPRATRDLYDAHGSANASALQSEAERFAKVVEGAPTIASLKTLLARRTDDPRWLNVRPPLRRLRPDERERLLREPDAATVSA
jgi:4-hydroxy-tetrahydrodipicolinate synthase